MHTTSLSDPRYAWAVLVGVGAILALVGALGMQFIGGYPPCNLCVWERYPYLIALLAVLIGGWFGRLRLALAVAALALAANVALATFHVGVEQGWFALPETCAAVGKARSIEELKAQLLAAPPRCDQVSLSWLGLSLAAWNGVYAAALLALALVGLWRGSTSAAEQHRHPRPA